MTKTDNVLRTRSEVIKREKKCDHCGMPVAIEREKDGLAIGSCCGCGTHYSNVKPVPKDGKWTFLRTDEFHELKPVVPF